MERLNEQLTKCLDARVAAAEKVPPRPRTVAAQAPTLVPIVPLAKPPISTDLSAALAAGLPD